MIYQAYELARLSTRPVAGLLKAGQNLARHEYNPFRNSMLHRAFAVSCELPLRGLKAYDKRRFDARLDGKDGALLSEQVVDSLPFADLVGFDLENEVERPKVLIAAALSGHHATLLRETVGAFAQNFETYMTDWKDARQVPAEAGDFGFDDYVDHLVAFMKTLGPGTHVVATCQAAPPAMVAAALLARDAPELVPASLTLMGGPIDTRVNAGFINKLTDKLPLSLFAKVNIQTVPGGYPGTGRRVYPGFAQLMGFILLNPSPHFKKHWGFAKDAIKGLEEDLAEFRDFYDEYFAVLDMTEAFYVDTLRKVFFEHHLATGKMEHRGKPVDFGLLTGMPLLTVEGERDNFCPVGQTEAAHAIMPNIPKAQRQHYIQPGVGHYGVFSGSRFRTEIYPVIRDFAAKFDAKRAAGGRARNTAAAGA